MPLFSSVHIRIPNLLLPAVYQTVHPLQKGKYCIFAPVMTVCDFTAGAGAHYLPDDARSRVPGVGCDWAQTSKKDKHDKYYEWRKTTGMNAFSHMVDDLKCSIMKKLNAVIRTQL